MKLMSTIFLCLCVLINTSVHAELLSGFEFLTPETQEMQLDDFSNPGMVSVEEGMVLFSAPGSNGKSCADCHGENGDKLDPKRIAKYPVYNESLKTAVTLQGQINLCWDDNLENPPAIYDSHESVALETLVRYLARGEVVNVDISGGLRKHYEAGRELFNMRVGQLDMACVHCHDQFKGKYLRAQKLNQGHSNGFPEYRLGTGQITSFQRRIAECFVSFRAQPFDFGSEELINLEVYVHARGNGLKIETPAVRY